MASALKEQLASRFVKDGSSSDILTTGRQGSRNDKEPREGDLIGDEDSARHMRWREHWNAKTPVTELKPMSKPVHTVILTYTDSNPCQGVDECDMAVRQLQDNYQQNLNLPDIPYNFLVSTDGNVYEGRGWDYRPFVPKKAFPRLRGSRIVIAQINVNFDDSILPPADSATWDLIQFGINNDFIHSEAKKIVSAPWI
ncbi:peptidoglycan recognition protein 4-like [Macrosteles quadrilineatus]|uniref:peptidoglycan recognition protein 4-like n=1 Tax=Macrosteles quadrilineatus TaxID=74068 RepID=UPI0023E1E041|nr:peptidoglycan recognition protein 4-like [Macrosteles quadrilineatus]